MPLSVMLENKCGRKAPHNLENTSTHIGVCGELSVLPDYDIHNKHVSNQPNHTHYGVESGDDNRDDNGVGVVVQVAGESAIRVASRLCEARGVVGVGEVLAEAAGVVVQRGELAPIIGTVVCALHGPRREEGAARVFSLDPGARLRTRCLRCPAGCVWAWVFGGREDKISRRWRMRASAVE